MVATYGQLAKTLSPLAKPPAKTLSPLAKPPAKSLSRKDKVMSNFSRKLSSWANAPFGTQPFVGGGIKPYTITTQRRAPQYGGLIGGFQAAGERARQANIVRQKRIEGMYSEMMARYQPGGAFEKRGLGEIERAKTKGVGQEMQQMISSGMYGTTTAAGTGRRWESEVGAPARLRLEDIMQQRLTGIQQQKAGFLERIQEPYPDYSALMSAIMR